MKDGKSIFSYGIFKVISCKRCYISFLLSWTAHCLLFLTETSHLPATFLAAFLPHFFKFLSNFFCTLHCALLNFFKILLTFSWNSRLCSMPALKAVLPYLASCFRINTSSCTPVPSIDSFLVGRAGLGPNLLFLCALSFKLKSLACAS